jgi:photosystem II stability/assembly factor-like uncharacterized protein
MNTEERPMASDTSISSEPYVYVGAGTGGLYRKSPGDTQWEELTNGLPPSPEVRVITIHPLQPDVVFVGTQDGVYRSGSRGNHWRRLNMPVTGSVVWSILFRPYRPNFMYVGMAPALIFRTQDGGDSWDQLPMIPGPDVITMSFHTRVIAMAVNPQSPDEIYAALEVGGMVRSLDGGENWEPINRGLREGGEDRMDLHGVQVSAAQPGTVYISTREGMFRSPDRGDHWDPIDIKEYSPITYTRDLLVSPGDPRTLYVSLGRAARSEVGALFRSPDLGESWERVDHDVNPQSTMMSVSVKQSNPSQIYCATRDGQVFGSLDAGATWKEYPLPEAAKEVYAVAVA